MDLHSQIHDLQSLFPTIGEVLRSSGVIVRRYFGKEIKPRYKEDGTPVTQADMEVETHLREVLSRLFPEASVLGEEYGETPGSGSLRWILDPIDGTRSFLMGTPLFGTLLALEKDGVPLLGAIYLPIQDELMIGSAATGTFVNGRKCHVSKVAELKQARLVLTDPADLLEQKRYEAMADLCGSLGLIRGFGDCYGYFLVARGSAEVMVDFRGVRYHDIAPMLPILQGAGGAFSAIDGSLNFAEGNALATNGLLHEEVRSILGGRPG